MSQHRTTTKPLWQRVASRVAGFFGVRFYDCFYGERELVSEIQHIEPGLPLDVRPATQDELEQLFARLGGDDLNLGQRALDNGSECLIAWSDVGMAGYSWMNREVVTLLGDRVATLPPEGVYTFNSSVWPEFRGKKVFQVLTEAVYRRAAAEGYTFCGNLVDKKNGGSIGARAKFGVVFRSAPILKLPGIHPFVLGRGLAMGATVPREGEVTGS